MPYKKDDAQFDQPHSTEEIDLTEFDEDFARAEIEEREFETIPDGKYQVKVQRVELKRAQTSGSPMLNWTMRILTPRFSGRVLFRNNVMGTPENLRWLKMDLHICGLDLNRLSEELQANLGKLIGVGLEVTKRTRGENENVYINRRIALEEEGDEYDAPTPF